MRAPLDDSISYSHFVSVVVVWQNFHFRVGSVVWPFFHDYSVDGACRSVTSLHYPSFSLSPVISLHVTVVSFHTLSPVRLDCLRTMSSASNLFWSLIVDADGVIHFSLIKCHRLGSSSERSLSRSCIQSIFLSFKDSYVESPTVTVYQLLALYSVHNAVLSSLD